MEILKVIHNFILIALPENSKKRPLLDVRLTLRDPRQYQPKDLAKAMSELTDMKLPIRREAFFDTNQANQLKLLLCLD